MGDLATLHDEQCIMGYNVIDILYTLTSLPSIQIRHKEYFVSTLSLLEKHFRNERDHTRCFPLSMTKLLMNLTVVELKYVFLKLLTFSKLCPEKHNLCHNKNKNAIVCFKEFIFLRQVCFFCDK